MARVLFTVWPFAGHLHPCIAIARALERRGHEVAFYSGVAVGDVIEGEGFRFFPFRNVDERRTTQLASSEFPYTPSLAGRLRSARHWKAKFKEWLLDTVPGQVGDLEPILSDWRPDVLVCDLAFWAPFLILHETRGIPVAVLSILAACILPGPDAPFWGQGARRPTTALRHVRFRVQRALVHWVSSGFRAQVNDVRRCYRLPAIDCSVTEYAGRMPLYIVPSAPEYDYNRRDLPASVNYVGPCLWDKPENEPPPAWLAQLPAGRPLIYVTEATIGASDPFLLRAASRAFRDLPVQVVMTTGKQRDPASMGLEGGASNIRVEAYIPQSHLLQRMSVMVTLGGSGGVLAALGAGVPVVVSPTEWDRPENAQRVVEAGAGLRIPPERCTPERLRSAVERVLADPSFRRNAGRLAAAFAARGGPVHAAELIERLAPAAGGERRDGVSVAKEFVS